MSDLPENTSVVRQMLMEKIQVLNKIAWEGKLLQPTVETWLENFSGNSGDQELEELNALFLLSNFMYFGNREIRELLKALYRDHVRYPFIQEIRSRGAAKGIEQVSTNLDSMLKRTRFLGVGNPADSGSFLLYFFRQENALSSKLFINTHELLEEDAGSKIDHVVFIDDFCGSGTTAKRYGKQLVTPLLSKHPDLSVSYCVLFGFQKAMSNLKQANIFTSVNAVIELDPSFKCFSKTSRYFNGAPKIIDKDFSKNMAKKYGQTISPSNPLGYKNGQLLLGFAHNTPNNSLPILWGDEFSAWNPLFPRFRKQYGWDTGTIS